ncbi:hypothetical protein CRE_11915 [Caenorhabditis remanei]|uniref:Uncharacterized protein n=1 Tax=Caenorhabditis remanei TaxID=31234 RepID=E3M4G4_CAERE|nr:hypothetical protein CRE_11915 [Caenorhabditis remanei]
MNIPSESQCELAYQLSNHLIYRLSQLYSFFVSLLAIPSLLFFIIKKVLPLQFHGNLKCLLIVYFSSSLVFSFESCLGFGYQFLEPFFVTTKCNLLIDPSLFKWFHTITLFTMTISMLLPIGFSIERFVALSCAKRYEHVRTLLGPILVFSLIGIDLLFIILIYQNEQFLGSYVSFILVPSTSAFRFNLFFYFLLFVQFFNLTCNCFLLKINNKLKSRYNRYIQRKTTLSLRYEMEEINYSSRFTLVVSFTHLLFVGCYVILGILARTLGESFFVNQVNYTAARAIHCSVPTYNLVIVFIGIKSLRHLNVKRRNTVNTTIQLKSTGNEGAKNYEDAIFKHWDMISK